MSVQLGRLAHEASTRSAIWICALPPLVAFSLLILTHARYGYFRDEFYYLACGHRLAWGYVDHPPITPLIARLLEATVGTTLLDLRVLPALAISCVVFLTCMMTRQLQGGSLAVLLSGLCVALSPGFLAEGTFLSVNAFDLLIWAAAQWIVLRWLLAGRPREWLWLGGVLGIGLLNKYTVALLGFGLVAGLLLTPKRRALRTRWPWIGAGVALLIWAPNLWWQASHGWPSIEFLHNIRADKNYPVNPFEFVAMQFAVLHPCIFPIAMVGLVSLFRREASRSLRFFGWFFATVTLLLMVEQAKFYYLFPAYPILFAAAGVAVERWMAGQLRRVIPVFALLIAGTAATMPLAILLLPLASFERYNVAIHVQKHIRFEQGRKRDTPIIFSDMLGWPGIYEAVSTEYQALPTDQRKECVILCANYGIAGALEFFSKNRNLPQPVSAHNNYYLWGAGDKPWSTVLAAGYDADTLNGLFADVRKVGDVDCEHAREANVELYICHSPKLPVNVIWERLKRFR